MRYLGQAYNKKIFIIGISNLTRHPGFYLATLFPKPVISRAGGTLGPVVPWVWEPGPSRDIKNLDREAWGHRDRERQRDVEEPREREGQKDRDTWR